MNKSIFHLREFIVLKDDDRYPRIPLSNGEKGYYATLPLGADSFEYVPPTRILAPRHPLDDETIMEYREYYAAARSRRIIPRRRW